MGTVKTKLIIMLLLCVSIFFSGCQKEDVGSLDIDRSGTKTQEELNEGKVVELNDYEQVEIIEAMNNTYVPTDYCEIFLYELTNKNKNGSNIAMTDMMLYSPNILNDSENEAFIKKMKLEGFMIADYAIALPVKANLIETYIVLNISEDEKEQITEKLKKVTNEYNYAISMDKEIFEKAIKNPYIYYKDGYLFFVITTEEHVKYRFEKLQNGVLLNEQI